MCFLKMFEPYHTNSFMSIDFFDSTVIPEVVEMFSRVTPWNDIESWLILQSCVLTVSSGDWTLESLMFVILVPSRVKELSAEALLVA
jgi:hypothetical protein